MLKSSVWLSRALSTTTRNQVSQGGLAREAEHPSPSQFTLAGSRSRELEPRLRAREQFALPAASAVQQPSTETERDEQNGGTYNLSKNQNARHA